MIILHSKLILNAFFDFLIRISRRDKVTLNSVIYETSYLQGVEIESCGNVLLILKHKSVVRG